MTGTERFGLARIGQVSMRARDLDKAVAFYRDTLGLTLLFQAPGMAFLQCGEIRLMLAKPESPQFDHPGSILYFKVEEIHGAHATLAERGVRFTGPPHMVARLQDHDLWLAEFRDPDENILALMCEVRRS